MATVTEIAVPDVELIESDGEPLETFWHFVAIALLVGSIRRYFLARSDFFTAGNMFLYFSEEQARNRDYRGPDFFFVDHVDGKKKRKWWAVWEENGRFPDVIIELLSPSTAATDRTVKKHLYEQTFRTREYFCFDPDTNKLEGWRLDSNGEYQDIEPNNLGRMRCEVFQLWLGPWKGRFLNELGIYPRFFDDKGDPIPMDAEAAGRQAKSAKRREKLQKELAKAEQRKAKKEKQRAMAEKQRAEIEKRHTLAEKRRADEAEAELVRLKARLAQLEGEKSQPPTPGART